MNWVFPSSSFPPTRHRRALPPSSGSACPIFNERVAAAWQEYWKKLFSTVKPTAVILNQDIHVQSLYGFCFRNGIKIPRDLSVICMESTEHVEWCDPLPTRMRFPVQVASGYFKKWVRGGCQPMGVKYLELVWIEGESVGKNTRR